MLREQRRRREEFHGRTVLAEFYREHLLGSENPMGTNLRDAASRDADFREAISAIDAGDVATLEHLVLEKPTLVRERLASPGAWLRDRVGDALDGFFRRPYLLWFVA